VLFPGLSSQKVCDLPEFAQHIWPLKSSRRYPSTNQNGDGQSMKIHENVDPLPRTTWTFQILCQFAAGELNMLFYLLQVIQRENMHDIALYIYAVCM
jgi:hypothetical protein